MRYINKFPGKFVILLALLFFSSTVVFAQFYEREPAAETDIDFGEPLGEVLHYSGYRTSEEDAWFDMNLYLQWVVDKEDQILDLTTFYLMDNNTALDERVQTFMRNNKLTLCTTSYPNEFLGRTYIINFSFDNYDTFGLMSIESMKWIKSRDYHLK